MPMAQPGLDRRIAAVRRFNRLYTQRIGLLQEAWLESPFSLTEARVLYELSHRDRPTATAIGGDLALDAGYLSRILRDFARRGLLARQTSPADGRQRLLSLTARGRKTFAPIDARSQQEIGALLSGLPGAKQSNVVDAMREIEHLLGARAEPKAPCILRPHAPGDMGWMVSRHGALYAQDYGFGPEFEALVAEIAAAFIRNFDPKRERCWIAEQDGENVGCVALVKQSARTAKLRLLLVEPKARGLGIGERLVDECVRFARAAGYRKITLWTQSILTAARAIYVKAGFERVGAKPHRQFGVALVGETWTLGL
jgi:DNA-binding MarR family transcriptional regulator/N-acetylglutamate synthase-like GNAT family acetyltransferase